MSHNENQIEMFTPSELEEQERIEEGARDFATITSEARAMLPIMQMPFLVRIKGNDETRKMEWSVFPDRDRYLCGKEVWMQIDWKHSTQSTLVLRIIDKTKPSWEAQDMIQLHVSACWDETEHLTLINNTHRMLRMWREITQATGVSAHVE